MGVGKGGQGPFWILKFLANKGSFLSFEWEKTDDTTFGFPWKNFGKIPLWLRLGQILPTPMAGSMFKIKYHCRFKREIHGSHCKVGICIRNH